MRYLAFFTFRATAFLAISVASGAAQAQQAPASSNDTGDTVNCVAQADTVKQSYIAGLSKSDRAMLRVKDIPILQPTNSVKIRVEKVWHAAFDECERKKRGGTQAQSSTPDGTIPLFERNGQLYVPMEGKSGLRAVPLTRVAAEGGTPSESLLKCVTADKQTLFFYRRNNGGTVSPVVPVEDAKNSYLDKNGKFMLTLDVNGMVTYRDSVKPASGTPAASDEDRPKLPTQPSPQTASPPN